MEHKIGLIGCGVVGQGLLQILHDKRDYLRDAFGFEARVVAIADKLKGTLIVPEGIDIPAVLALLGAGKRLADYPKATPAQVEALDPLDMIERTDADIIAEMTYTDIKTGEPATSYIKKALRTGKTSSPRTRARPPSTTARSRSWPARTASSSASRARS